MRVNGNIGDLRKVCAAALGLPRSNQVRTVLQAQEVAMLLADDDKSLKQMNDYFSKLRIVEMKLKTKNVYSSLYFDF